MNVSLECIVTEKILSKTGTPVTAPSHEKTPIFCPVHTALSLIGGKYKAVILWNLLEGTLRFSELRKSVSGATPKMLTQQLRELEADGLITRKVYAVVPPRVDYSLTESGLSLRPVLEAMYTWGNEYLKKQGCCPNCGMRKPE